ncbi:MAG TPA: hypothetical protein VK004_00955 [Ignavibacteria bacterium]|nr:hypothetical protein [Ignavibacteria bacterium]
MNRLLLLTVVLFCSNVSYSQWDTVRFSSGGYDFVSYWSDLQEFGESKTYISKNGQNVFEMSDPSKVESIAAEDLRGNGEKSILINTYSGGAHCCFTMYIGEFSDGKFSITDTIGWGDSYYEAKDLNNDGKMELVGSYVGMAYEFTSFAGSQFPMLIYGYKNGRVQVVNEDFKKFVYEDIEEFKKELQNAYPNYSCPEKEDEYWGSDAGEVRSFLAAIVFGYVSIDEADKGFEFVDEFYKCPNKEQFKEFLRNTYK